MEGTCSVVVASSRGVGKRVIGVIDALEFSGPRWTLGGVGGDSVGVGFEGGAVDVSVSPASEKMELWSCSSPFVGISDLLLGC